MKNFVLKFIAGLFLFLATSYVFVVFALPKIINSTDFQSKIENFITQKTKTKTQIENLTFKINPDLTLEGKIEKLTLKNDKNEIFLNLDKIEANFKPLKFMPEKIKINYVFFDKTNFKSKNKSHFKLKNLPEIIVNKIDIILEKNSQISLYNLKTVYDGEKYTINFKGEVISKYISSKVKIEEKENLFIQNEKIFASNLRINLKNHPLIINGMLFSKNSYDFSLKGKSLPIAEIKSCFLFYRKQVKPFEKNFIENFYDFRGLADVDLKFKNKNIFGNITLNNFQTKSVKFNVPFYYPKGIFYFKGNKISLKTQGTFGKEKLYTDFFADKLFTKEKIVEGSLISNIENDFAKTYIPNTEIVKKAGLKVKYRILHHKIEVQYFLNIKKGANIYYKKLNPGFVEFNRTIYAKTLKKGNNLHLKTYNYSTDKKILYGEGFFTRKNNKFQLDKISLNTVDYAPVSIIGISDEYLKNGVFKGNLEYFGKEKNLSGKIDLYFKKFVHPKITLENIYASGTINKNVIDFASENIYFAKGILKAKGFYDIKKHNTDIFFDAKNIDANIASNQLLNLEEQFFGKACAKIYFKSFNKFEKINAHCDFSIKNGMLTKLSSREFLIKNSKFKLKKIVKIDPKKARAVVSNIRGSFDIFNNNMKNIEIFNESKYLSLYLQGSYNIESQYACICLWGKFNKKAQDGIKIFFVPLSWVTKFVFKNERTKNLYKNQIEKIPPIEAKPKEQEIVLVNIEGNINSLKNLKIELKNIR